MGKANASFVFWLSKFVLADMGHMNSLARVVDERGVPKGVVS